MSDTTSREFVVPSGPFERRSCCDRCLCFCGRHLLHHHRVVPVEGDRHHPGQLPAALHPEVPAQTLLSTQLLQADHLTTKGAGPRWTGFLPPRQSPQSVVVLRSSLTRTPHLYVCNAAESLCVGDKRTGLIRFL